MSDHSFGHIDVMELLKRRHDRPGDFFMETLQRDGRIIAPGTYCGQDAKIASTIYANLQSKQPGCTFNAVYGSGWAISAMLWGRPDMGFHDRTMMTLLGKYIVMNAHPLPVILDAETGYALEPVTVTETVQAYHDIGVGLAHLEDQATRRCGNMGGKKCIEMEDMVAKIKFWLAASHAIGTSMRLMVRTDALTAVGGGLENAIERGKRYMDTDYQGRRPDVLWADAMIGPEVIDPWIQAMRKHDPNMILALNYSPNKDWMKHYRKIGHDRPPTYDELYQNGDGFRVLFHTILSARAAMESCYDTFQKMALLGPEALWDLHERQRTHPVGDSQGMSNAKPWQAMDQFIGGDAVQERYHDSQGYGSDPKP